MNELHLQDKFLVPFFQDSLGYQEVKANTVSQSLIIEEDLQTFIEESSLNQKPYQTLLRKYKGNKKALLIDLMRLIAERIASSRNMALFINANKSISLQGVKLHLFYTSDSVIHGNTLFEENIFSVVQEFPYKYKFQDQQIFSFRPDITLFVNGIYLGYSELKNNYTNQTAKKNGRRKVIKDYFDAIRVYHQHIDTNNLLGDKEKQRLRKDLLKIFENAIHITTTDIGETYVIRTLADYFDEVLALYQTGKFDREAIEKKARAVFKPYPLLKPDAEKKEKLKELFAALYAKLMLEKEILYYNFIEREVQILKGKKEVKDQPGRLISPRPKQKFGTDKIIAKIDEFLAHEHEPDYFANLLEKQLKGVSQARKKELLEKRQAYANNKNVYSLLMQYAAGFGKSNIIGWSALQLKDLRRPDSQGKAQYVYDKIMIVVDRLQLRSQIDSLLLNMNIDKRMVLEATNKETFQQALASDTRLVIINLQKFGAVRKLLAPQVLKKLAGTRIVFLIDEIHRSNSGDQHKEMISIFDELQHSFDSPAYAGKSGKSGKTDKARKKNLLVGFTATPNDHTLARFGEFSGYAESEKLWRSFDSYTMKEAIDDGYILNPLKNIVPIASRMLFGLPNNLLKGFTQKGLTEKEYQNARKKQIYENRDRINAIAKYVADLLVKDVYRQIRGTGKAMLAVSSIKAAIAYYDAVKKHFHALVGEPKYQKYADAPIHIVYSDNQEEQSAKMLNGGLTEEKVLERFALDKNGLMIVVAKLQTGFDEKKLHTLFLDKEIRGINAIQTISRVNRKTNYKNDCKIVDFSYNNVNVQNIKDAFEDFSDVVVSDFDPFGDKKVLAILLTDLKKSDTYDKFFTAFMAIYQDPSQRDAPESFLDFESSLQKYLDANPQRTAATKAKAAQYFTILNRIEYVIELDAKFNKPGFLLFWRKFNMLYNLLHQHGTNRDPIEVYFDNQIGIVEVVPEAPQPKKEKPIQVAEGIPGYGKWQFDILAIIVARNAQEAKIGELIKEFAAKIAAFFQYVRESSEGERLIVKIKSHVSEDEIHEEFAKIYNRYRILHKRTVGDSFFDETANLIGKLCDDFEKTVKNS